MRKNSGIFQIAIHIAIFVLLSSISMQASNMHWDRPVVSKGYDTFSNKPVEPLEFIPNTAKEIWASAWLHDAPSDTRVTISWYYFDNGEKSIIYQERIRSTGTKPIFSRFDESKAEYFPVAKYIVEFSVENGPTASVKFEIIPSKNNRTGDVPGMETTDAGRSSEPSAQDDDNLITDMAKNYPQIKKQLTQLKLYREESPDRTVSLILPSSWPAYTESAPIIFHRKSTDEKSGGEITVVRTKIDSENLSRHTPEKILTKYISSIIDPEDKIIRKLRIARLAGSTIASVHTLKKTSHGEKVHFYALRLTGSGTLVMTDTAVASSAYKIGGFLSALGLYSLRINDEDRHYRAAKSVSGTFGERIKHDMPLCKPPESNRDNEMVRSILRRIPNPNRKILTLSLARYTDLSGRFSLIVPSKWTRQIDSDENTPLLLDTKRKGYEYQYSLRILPVEAEELRKLSPGQVVQVVGESVFESVREDARKKQMRSEMVNALTSTTRGKRAYGYALMHLSDRTGSAWVGEVIHYDGDLVYLLTFLTDDPDLDLVQWFQSLGLNSFWTPNFCAEKSRGN